MACREYEGEVMIGPMVTLAIFGATLLTAAGPAETTARPAGLSASGLTCEYAVNPLGVDAAQPRFGWVLKSDTRGQVQSAYQILVAGSEEKLRADAADKWDSGKIASYRSVNIEYRGKPLASGEKCCWKVRVWDKQGRPSPWSEPATFEMGLVEQSDWKGQWIGFAPGTPAEGDAAKKAAAPAPLLRKEFAVTKDVRRARVYISGIGWSKLYLNGQKRFQEDGATDHYTLKGEGEEIYEPRFTYHPVRYVQVEGHPGKLAIDDLQGRVTYSDVDLTGRFECSNPMVNRIHQNVRWTLTNGLFGMPLDCLYREHWAWTDPATITGSLYPRQHMPLFWTKWLEDIAHSQQPNGDVPAIAPSYHSKPHFDPAWGGNYPILVWYLYQYLDDERILQRHYVGMKRVVDYHTSIAKDHIITSGSYGDHMLPGKRPGQEQGIQTR